MPRPPKDYSVPVPYVPHPPPVAGSSPEEIVRATWDEFSRLAALLADRTVTTNMVRKTDGDNDD